MALQVLAQLTLIHWSPDKIEFELDVPSRQFMVLSEIFYPKGWKITSHPEWKIYSVNTILRGIYVPKGYHRMVMEFKPQDIYFGSLLTWVSTIIIIGSYLVINIYLHYIIITHFIR